MTDLVMEQSLRDEAAFAQQLIRVARVVAARALDVPDCRLLFDTLGIDRQTVEAAQRVSRP